MSTEAKEVVAADTCCASCGKAGIDDVKLKDCDGGCDLVKYCNDVCQENHREEHEEECKRRLAELRDRDLFTQPDESHWGECPICFLPMSIEMNKSMMMKCCSKRMCMGCAVANTMREGQEGLERRCVFCREPPPKSDKESDKLIMKRVKKNDPVAMREMGRERYGEGDYDTGLQYLIKAAKLGDTEAHFGLSLIYLKGVKGGEKDEKKFIYHSEEAAMAGHPDARHNLGLEEGNNGRYDRARKHFIIAANLGYHDSLEALRELYADGLASKEDYAGALRAYQAAIDATKSKQREKAEQFYGAFKNR